MTARARRFDLIADRVRSLAALVVIFTFLVMALADAIPASRTRDAVAPRLRPAMVATGIFQPWGLFAPNPMTIEVRTYAVVTFEDGTSTTWFPSDERNNIDSNRNERWRKWEGRIRENRNAELWDETARHVVHRFEVDGVSVAEVDLVRRWSQIPSIDQQPTDRIYEQFIFYRWSNLAQSGEALTSEDQPENRQQGRSR